MQTIHEEPDETDGPNSNHVYTIKINAEEEAALKKVAGLYQQIEEYGVSVRPWFELDYAKKPDINLITQFSLFKCMHEQCIFAIDSVELWIEHMEMHLKFIEVCMKEEVVHKTRRDEMKKFRECPYCGWLATANRTLIDHMHDEHGRSIFQCSYCFYRTCEMDNMVLHHETYHKEQPRDILLCGDQREFDATYADVMRNRCDDFVTKIRCGQGKYKRKSN